MYAARTTAKVAGILFIAASALAIVGGSLLSPLGASDYLSEVAASEGQVVSGALLETLLAVSVFAIAATLFPILRRHNEGMALGYVGMRVVEGVFIGAAATSGLLVLSLSRNAGAGAEPLGTVLLAARDWTYLIGTMFVFGLSALMLNAMLYRSRLVPVWLSAWGFIGGALLVARAVAELFGQEFSGAVQGVFAAPIGLQEMVLAVWLIVKGFEVSHLPTPMLEGLTIAKPKG